jgi:aldehyde dehydrogenase (NAD+)
MMATIVAQRTKLKHPDKFFIDGQWVDPSTNATIDVIAAATEEIYMTVAEANEVDMARAVDAARRAFDTGPWPRMSPAERAGYLVTIAGKIQERWPDFADTWTSEMGILRMLSGMMGPFAGGIFGYMAAQAGAFPFEEPHPSEFGMGASVIVREPVGVVGAIVPWNAPPILAAQKIAPALLAGCTMVLKASPEAPGTLALLAEIIEEAGLPRGVLNFLTADRAVSELLVRNPAVDKIAFTGSSAAGRRIASICGERMARTTLELGGKSAAVILDDVDIAAAAQQLTMGTTQMTGQLCAAMTRVVVTRDRYDQMVEALAAGFKAIKVGDPFDPEMHMGPLATAQQRDRVERYINIGKQEGAKLITGGGRPAHLNRGFYVQPTIFADVDNSMTIAREEIFGPVISVIPANDEAHALEIANDSDFGLAGAVFTDDVDKAYRFLRGVRAGWTSQSALRGDPSMPFGGFKQSGIGREMGTAGIHPYVEVKSILLNGVPSHLKN